MGAEILPAAVNHGRRGFRIERHDRPTAEKTTEVQVAALRTTSPMREVASILMMTFQARSLKNCDKVNVMCRTFIENAINDNYRDNALNIRGVDDVSFLYGKDRVLYVLAATVQKKSWDGRISDKNEEWANAYLGGEKIDAECRFTIGDAHYSCDYAAEQNEDVSAWKTIGATRSSI